MHSKNRQSRLRRTLLYIAPTVVAAAFAGSGLAGWVLGPGLIHPTALNPDRAIQTKAMLQRTGAVKTDFSVRALDGITLRGWKVKPPTRTVPGFFYFTACQTIARASSATPNCCCATGIAFCSWIHVRTAKAAALSLLTAGLSATTTSRS